MTARSLCRRPGARPGDELALDAPPLGVVERVDGWRWPGSARWREMSCLSAQVVALAVSGGGRCRKIMNVS